MKVRLKPAFRSRLLATGVSLVAFVAIVSGFVQESQEFSPDQSMKLAGANSQLPPEVLVTQKPTPTVSPSVASSPSPTTSTSPTAKPTKSPSTNAITPSPSATQKPTAKPTTSAAPSVNPSPSSLVGAVPATPALPVTPEVNEFVPEPDLVVFTCMSPGGNTREPSGSSCPSKWGYVLTQV